MTELDKIRTLYADVLVRYPERTRRLRGEPLLREGFATLLIGVNPLGGRTANTDKIHDKFISARGLLIA